MSKAVLSLDKSTPEPLCSHAPLSFVARPQAKYYASRQTASRLSAISNWKLNSESAREEPRLRHLLGHLSVHEEARACIQAQARRPPQVQTNELSTYLQQVPSFREFQAAIELQLATIAQITAAAAAAAAQRNVFDSHTHEVEDDSDGDSYDGDDCSDGETAAEYDDSSTDNDSLGTQSECGSPTSCSSDAVEDEEEGLDLWAIRPLAPYMRAQLVQCS